MVVFDKVLIANRGEIACRAIRTLRQMRLQSVAIYSSVDAQSLHVAQADEAVCVGGPAARDSYLSVAAVLSAAAQTGASALFPGYGFLSENAEFAQRCQTAGLVFIGPTVAQLRSFGLKHEARTLASAAGVPLLPGSGLLTSLDAARSEAARIGFPVLLKSTAGGGGIGLSLCEDEAALASSFEGAVRLGESHFGQGGVFVEKYVRHARHVEIQIFGDGEGNVVALGERDCSAQRRNQKVLEETPAPGISDGVRRAMREAALRLARQCKYRSAGTVEFIYDLDSAEFYFLEVNARLQVEHGVTELTRGIDLVQWMIDTARGCPPELDEAPRGPAGHAIEARVYAESPANDFRPSAGLVTRARFPREHAGLRVDTWIETGVEVSPFYDPMLAKVMVLAASRAEALAALDVALGATVIDGVDTNLEYLKAVIGDDAFQAGRLTTRGLEGLPAVATGIEVLEPGTFTTVQAYPGRLGLWHVGIPPSGPMDPLSLRLGNRVVGNPEGAAALEMTMGGPTLLIREAAVIALTGADMRATLDGTPVPRHVPVRVRSGQRLAIGHVGDVGARAYLCIRNGLSVPEYLGSRATFSLGRFGGFGGRALAPGDRIAIGRSGAVGEPRELDAWQRPELTTSWEVGVTYGPHGAPDFFTEADIETFFATTWEVHYNSARTGVRLVGPRPEWARPDGGEAGLHPSNIHDNAYAFGAVDYTGDMPIILGPDGPSLGGFVCPATVVHAELWKLGQLKAGDRLRFVRRSVEWANERERQQDRLVAGRAASDGVASVAGDDSVATRRPARHGGERRAPSRHQPAPVLRRERRPDAPAVTYRLAGDKFLLVEYGEMVLDLNLRFRVHVAMRALEERAIPGIVDLTPGIRSLMVHYEPKLLSLDELIDALDEIEAGLPSVRDIRVPTRIVHLPLSWDDEATQLAIRKYTQVVRPDAPWAPSNIEFIRRINGLADEQAVKDVVFGASYLVLGLGDVYLGAPVATPIDPRHRLVTTKYNPARTWTPENAVGIGGAYLCIYGMEGPGGYQLFGRTLQVFNRFRTTRDFGAGKPWLLRFFDQIRFYPVGGQELLELRDAFAAGRHVLKTEQAVFDLAEYNRFLVDNAASIAEFKGRQQRAFDAERQSWAERGLSTFSASDETPLAAGDAIPEGSAGASSTVPGSVWKLEVKERQRVQVGQRLAIIESMKMEIPVLSPRDGVVSEVRVTEGATVAAGQPLVVVM